jgi:hypothetical protein
MTPSGALHRLIYTSSAVGVLRADELDRILLRARASNERSGVTGLLLFHEGSFLQVIEGSPAGVLSLMERIKRDRRHTRLAILESRICVTRAFPRSPIAYVSPRHLTPGQRQDLGDLVAGARRHEASGAGESLVDQLAALLSCFQQAKAA